MYTELPPQVASIARALQKQLRRKPNALEKAAMARCASLMAVAEDARSRILRGDSAVSYDMAVRADGAARRALRDFWVIVRQPRKPVRGDGLPTLAELMNQGAANA